MDKVCTYQYIASLILKERLGTISEPEKSELIAWLQESHTHRTLYENLIHKDFGGDLDNYRRIDAFAGLQRYRKTYPTHRISLRWITVAAMLVLLLGSSLFLYNRQNSSREAMTGILPGSSQAVLVMNDGSVHTLNRQMANEVIRMNGVTAMNTGKQLSYSSSDLDSLPADTEIFNELRIPRGGEYQVVLADGTRVWLNAKSVLKYPVQFRGKERVVFLEGEAYFEVTKDKEHPFRVMTNREVSVKVLGTSFKIGRAHV